ncbi:2157_t:CDS:2 [Gigaspora rosea]|nr:2157_t:CDS:2 [Gigaspora rosea]
MVNYEDAAVINTNIKDNIAAKKMITEEQRNTRSKQHENHSLDLFTNKFGTIYRTLTKPMLANIEFWTTKGNLSMRTQRQLLEAKYANAFFLLQDLLNAIQKNLKSKLGSEYNKFSREWYQMRNTLSRSNFDFLWNSLLNKYPSSVTYLNRVLESQKQQWALCYISRIFIAGMHSTQRVEGQTGIIKSMEAWSIVLHLKFIVHEISYNAYTKEMETVYTETYIELAYKVANISYKRIHKSLNQRKEYVMANGLSKKAIQIRLDEGPSAIQEFINIMKNYIVRYTPKHNQELTRRNPRTLLDNSHNNIDPSLIQNPIIRARKGAPHKSQFKGSQETNLKNKERPKAAGENQQSVNNVINLVIIKLAILERTLRKRDKKCSFLDFENALHEWVLRSQENIPITDAILVEKAKGFAKILNIPDSSLKFSNGWLAKFKKRNNIMHRTKHGEEASADHIAITFAIPQLRELLEGYELKDIYNMDETGLFYRYK